MEPITHPLGDFLRAHIASPFWAHIANSAVAITAILTLTLGSAPMLIWMERKVSAHIQARLGPMRVGPHGLLQSLADILKLLCKEIITPRGADHFFFFLAPIIPLSASFLVLTAIPFDHNLFVANVNMGVPFVIGVSGLGIFGVLIGGWASNNKYSLLGSLRSGAQLISYEISLTLIMLFVVLLSGTANLRGIVFSQQGDILDWWIFKAPLLGALGFVLFMVSSTAELNRGPFDIAEAEQEIVAGFHTEYSGMAFALFFLAEYINMIAAASLGTLFFLGGFLPPLLPTFGASVAWAETFNSALTWIPGWAWFGLKTLLLIALYMLFRWTFPRPRVDQVMALEWKFLLPINLFLLIGGAALVSLGWLLP